MRKLGENVPLLIDKAVDFMASSQWFRTYLKNLPPRNAIPSGIPDE
ncbi:protein YibT, partial [Enterobacter hormaechei]